MEMSALALPVFILALVVVGILVGQRDAIGKNLARGVQIIKRPWRSDKDTGNDDEDGQMSSGG
jgi:hypothetical protein